MIQSSFSHIRSITESKMVRSNVWDFKKEVFDTARFLWIGVGELSLERPSGPFIEAPWDMTESGGDGR
jgi:hypothetical protein